MTFPEWQTLHCGGSNIASYGIRPFRFSEYFYENIGCQNIEAIESHPLAHTIAKYFEANEEIHKQVIEGSPMEILEILEIFAKNTRLTHVTYNLKNTWTPLPAKLNRKLTTFCLGDFNRRIDRTQIKVLYLSSD
jgi:hypothetical protein